MRAAFSKVLRAILVVALIIPLLTPSVKAQDGDWRDLTRESNKDVEHVIIFVTGWQLLNTCIFGPLPQPKSAAWILDDCESNKFVPAWTWKQFKDAFGSPALDEILYHHAVGFPSYPVGTPNPNPSQESKILYYSYTGKYKEILDKQDGDGKYDGERGECAPDEQLDQPDADGYQCLPSYSLADTSIIFSRVNDKVFWEALFDNLIAGFTDFSNLEKYAQLVVEKFKQSPWNPDLASVQSEFIALVTTQAVAKTMKEFGLDEAADVFPQHALFDRRAGYLQALINSVVNRFDADGKSVEIIVVGHSQGGLVATYWAGWNGSQDIQKDASHVNAVVTLDSPLQRKISPLLGLSNLFIEDIPPISVSVDFPAVSLPFLGEIFPANSISVTIPIGEYLSAYLSTWSIQLFYGIDAEVDNAASQVPIYTIRNLKDLFVTADFASLGRNKAWHDKLVEYSGDGVNHSQVSYDRKIARDIQYVSVSGSIYAPNKAAPFTYSASSSTNQRLQIELASPPFLANGRKPSPQDFSVVAIPSGGGVQSAYILNVTAVVNQASWSQSSSRNTTAPPLLLTTTFPQEIPAGMYDLQVTYDNFVTNIIRSSTAISREAIRVVGAGEYSDISLVVVVDRSGSMGEFLNGGVMKMDAVKNAASFLSQLTATTAQNRFGIVAFEGTSQRLYPPGALQEVTPANLSSYLSALASLSPRDGTRLTDALVNAHSWFEVGGITHRTAAIVALTDGASSDTWSRNFTDIPVFTIGFGQETSSFNEAELKKIAQDTGGAYYYAPSEAELRTIYDTIQRQVSGANGVIQLEKPVSAGAQQTIGFVVDPTIKQFRLAVNWDTTAVSGVAIKLITPKGVEVTKDNFSQVLPGSNIFETAGSWIFSASGPEAGNWQIVIANAQVASTAGLIRITSSSNTLVQLEQVLKSGPGVVGQPLRTLLNLTDLDPTWSVAALTNVQATVKLPSGERITIDLFDDGFHGDGNADDRVFAAIIPSRFVQTAGSYIIEAVVKGLLTDRGTGAAFASAAGEALPFERIFTTVQTVEAENPDANSADLASMVVRKPGSATDFCVTYVNRGPGTANNVSLFVAADNAIYATSSVPAQRNPVGFSFGWNLGQLPPGSAGTIDTSVIQLEDNKPVQLASVISAGGYAPNVDPSTVPSDPTSVDLTSRQSGVVETQQLAAGWTLLGLKKQPTVDLPKAVLCGLDAPVTVILGFDKVGLTYDPTVPAHINTLKELDALRGYWVRTDGSRTLAINGNDVPVDTPIELHSGWNLINYLPSTTQTIADALASISGEYSAVLGYKQGATSFYSSIPPRLNTLQTLEPGNAYWIYLNRARTLVYHDQPTVTISASDAEQANRPQRAGGVTPTNRWLNFYSPLVLVDGQLAQVGTLVEAFTASGLKIGEAHIVEPGAMELLTAYADDSFTANLDGAKRGEPLFFKVNGHDALVANGVMPQWTNHGDLVAVTLVVGTPFSYQNQVFLPTLTR